MLNATLPIVYPGSPRARRTDPLTSHQAADSNDTGQSRSFVMLALYELGPCAQFQLEKVAEGIWSPSRIRTAVSELVDLGLVVFTGDHMDTPSGRRAQVWGIA